MCRQSGVTIRANNPEIRNFVIQMESVNMIEYESHRGASPLRALTAKDAIIFDTQFK